MKLTDALETVIDHRGRTPRKLGGEWSDNGVPVVSAISIKDGRVDYSTVKYISEELSEKWMPERLQVGDVLLTSEAPLGRVAQVDNPSVVAGQRIFGLRAKPHLLNSYFLRYWLTSREGQSALDSLSSGSTVIGIRQSQLLQLDIPTPPLREQEAIAEVLGALDDKIEANRSYSQKATQRGQLLVDHWLTNDSPQSAWTLDRIIEFNPRTKKPDLLAPYLAMQNIPTDEMCISSWSQRPPKSGARFTKRDTLLARITPCLQNGKTGLATFLNDGTVGVSSTEIIVLRARDGLPYPLPFFIAKNAAFRNFAAKKMVGSSGRQRVKPQDLKLFATPPLQGKILDVLTEQLSVMPDLLDSYMRENRILAELRDTLLGPLVSGRLRVKDAAQLVGEVA